MRRRASLLCVSLLLVGPGCAIARWGYPNQHSGVLEVWEIPAGALLLPVAVPLDVVGSLFVSIFPLTPSVLAFPMTSSALTLLNPECNLNWSAQTPMGVIVYSGKDDEGDDDDWDAPEIPDPPRRLSGEEKLAQHQERVREIQRAREAERVKR